jgi:hypothetical protein
MKQNLVNGNGKSKSNDDPYVFRLYVTGASPNSLRAIANTRNYVKNILMIIMNWK